MKKKNMVAAVLFAGCLSACQNGNATPLWDGEKVNGSLTTVIISDLHLGVDPAFAENVANLPYLTQFLKEARSTKALDEIVIAGDMFDGWFLPFSYGVVGDYLSFYKKVALANASVVDAVNAIIKDGRIKVVYVPGNHDVDFSAAMAEAIFPGIFQARDSEGVGTYRTGVKQEVAIEHGHRYNVFCAPDPLTDTALRAGKTLIGPGYFYTRIAATSLKSGHHPRSFAFPDFGVAAADIPTASAEIQNAYRLYQVWNGATSTIGVDGMTFESKSIPCGIASYADFYSLSDLVPLYRNGTFTNTLFKGIDTNWQALQILNRTGMLQAYGPSVLESAALEATDAKSTQVYFANDKSVDVVVFGHTHAPLIEKNQGGFAGKTYVNSGTWVDTNIDGDKTTRTYVKVVSSVSKAEVGLYRFEENGTSTLKAS
jgi:UDP-2,3-diacylglucosamine pyrophosphatase LpxH